MSKTLLSAWSHLQADTLLLFNLSNFGCRMLHDALLCPASSLGRHCDALRLGWSHIAGGKSLSLPCITPRISPCIAVNYPELHRRSAGVSYSSFSRGKARSGPSSTCSFQNSLREFGKGDRHREQLRKRSFSWFFIVSVSDSALLVSHIQRILFHTFNNSNFL